MYGSVQQLLKPDIIESLQQTADQILAGRPAKNWTYLTPPPSDDLLFQAAKRWLNLIPGQAARVWIQELTMYFFANVPPADVERMTRDGTTYYVLPPEDKAYALHVATRPPQPTGEPALGPNADPEIEDEPPT